MKKSILLIIGLVFLNACAEYSALVGPSYTLAKSGSIVQTGNVYVSSYVIKKAIGQSPGEYALSLAKKSDLSIFLILDTIASEISFPFMSCFFIKSLNSSFFKLIN